MKSVILAVLAFVFFLGMTSIDAGALECTLCVKTFQALDIALKNNATDKELIQIVEELCAELPAKSRPECRFAVKIYGPRVIRKLAAEDPAAVCKSVQLCETDLFLANSTECTICKLSFRELEAAIKNNATDKEIIDIAQKFCNELTPKARPECHFAVKIYGPRVLRRLAEEDPSEVCKAVKLCSTETITTSPAECLLCEATVKTLEKQLENNATEQELLDTAKKFCNELPEKSRPECRFAVKIYGPHVIKKVATEDPHFLCKSVGLCKEDLFYQGPGPVINVDA